MRRLYALLKIAALALLTLGPGFTPVASAASLPAPVSVQSPLSGTVQPPPGQSSAQPPIDMGLIAMGVGAVAGVMIYNYATLGPIAAFPFAYGETLVALPVWVGASRFYATASAVLGVWAANGLYHGLEGFFPGLTENRATGK